MLFYRKTRRRVDLGNLEAAICDILTHYEVIEDDHSGIISGMDGSRVRYDRERPRVEITIAQMKEDKECAQQEDLLNLTGR